MSHAFPLICGFLACMIAVGSTSSCTAPFVIEAGKCVFVNADEVYTWCDANRQCQALGGELLSSYASLKLLASMPSANCSKLLWVGVTDLGDEQGTNQSGWQRIHDYGLLPLDASLWHTGMPNSNGNQDCVMKRIKDEKFIDNQCNNLRGFMCESVSPPYKLAPGSATWQAVSFKRTSYNPSSKYCYTDVTPVANVLSCLSAAVNAGTSRHVLYNRRQRLCRLLEFADTQVEEEIETSEDWVKFGVV